MASKTLLEIIEKGKMKKMEADRPFTVVEKQQRLQCSITWALVGERKTKDQTLGRVEVRFRKKKSKLIILPQRNMKKHEQQQRTEKGGDALWRCCMPQVTGKGEDALWRCRMQLVTHIGNR